MSKLAMVLAAGLVASVVGACWGAGGESAGPSTRPAVVESPLAFAVEDIEGKSYDLAQHRGQVVLLVNVASKCGLTKQYAGLEELYRKYKDQGLVVIGFPANDFGNQEPGSNEEIATFCSTKYDVTFPMMAKISVKGDNKHPLYVYLTESSPFPGEVGWNFAKFLVGRDGRVVARFEPKTTPQDEQVVAAVETALQR